MCERLGHRWIDHVQPASIETELACPIEQPLAVERHGRRGTVGAREQIGTEPLRTVMPDLRAVERQDHRLAHPRGDGHADFGQQAVAVDVNDVGIRDGGGRLAADSPGAGDRSRAEDALKRPARRSRDRDDAGDGAGGGLLRRRMRDEGDRVAPRPRPLAKLERQQRVRGLIGRQMGRDVDDLQLTYARRNSVNVAGAAFNVPIANSKKRSRLSQKAASSASVRL
jgi:hypothetical protein